MMSTKLTLRLNEKLINKAKKAAKIRGVSLSKLVADYFQLVTVQKKREVPDSPILSEVESILSSKADNKKLLKSYKKHTEKKYL